MYRGKLLEYFLKVFLLQLACFMSSWVNCQEVDTDYNEVIIETAVRRPTTPQLPAVRPSPWIAIPESAFPFPLIPQTAPMRAMAVLNGKTGLSTGQLLFNQNSANEPVIMSILVNGLQPNTLHGLHIHGSGDLSSGCQSISTHFNPFNLVHGSPTDTFHHAGDLGNMQTDGLGRINFTRWDNILSLSGPFSILGRSVALHDKADDLGRGDNVASKLTGNAGNRIACGVIGLINLSP